MVSNWGRELLETLFIGQNLFEAKNCFTGKIGDLVWHLVP